MLQRTCRSYSLTVGLALAAAAALASFPSESQELFAGSLILVGVDEPLLGPDDPSTRTAWRSALVTGAELVVAPVPGTRPSGWRLEETTLSSTSPGKPVSTERTEPPTLATPDGALFAFQFLAGDVPPPAIATGRYPSLLPTPALLHTTWSADVDLHGRRWRLSTTHEKRGGGALLAGSMALLATDASGRRETLMPPARGMAFARQEILWLGDLDGDDALDVIIKRTWLTGKIDYLLVVGRWRGSVTVDPDRPSRYYESGVGESASELRHRSQLVTVPPGRFGSAAFAITDEAWNAKLNQTDGKATSLYDRHLPFGDDKVRFTFDYVPRSAGEVPSSTPEAFTWGGPVVVRAHYRGRSQIIAELGQLESALRVAIGSVESRLVVRIEYMPHYNNSLTYEWVWNEEQGRFVRIAESHVQGC